MLIYNGVKTIKRADLQCLCDPTLYVHLNSRVMCVRACVCIYVRVCVPVPVRARAFVCVRACVRACVRVCVCM